MPKRENRDPQYHMNRGLRWGRTLGRLEGAQQALRLVDSDLLSQADQELLKKAKGIVAGLEQRAWEQQISEITALARKPRSKR